VTPKLFQRARAREGLVRWSCVVAKKGGREGGREGGYGEYDDVLFFRFFLLRAKSILF